MVLIASYPFDASQETTETTEDGSSRSDAKLTDDGSKAMIRYYPRTDGRCYPHEFTSSTKTGDMMGRGAYGDVFWVECTLCHNVRVAWCGCVTMVADGDEL